MPAITLGHDLTPYHRVLAAARVQPSFLQPDAGYSGTLGTANFTFRMIPQVFQ